PEDLHGAQRTRAPFEHRLHPAPLLQVPEGTLGGPEDRLEGSEPLRLTLLLRRRPRLAEVCGDASAHPGTAVRGEDEYEREQRQEGDRDPDRQGAAGSVGALWNDLRGLSRRDPSEGGGDL